MSIESRYLHDMVLSMGAFAAIIAVAAGAFQLVFGGAAFFFLLLLGVFYVWQYASGFQGPMLMKMIGAQKVSAGSGIQAVLKDISRRAGLESLPSLYVIPVKVKNAFSAGTRDNPVIGLTEGIVNALNERELAGVLAHEVAHIENHDLFITGTARFFTMITSGISILAQAGFLLALPFLLITGHLTLEIIGGIFLLMLAPTLSRLLILAMMRSREFGADYRAAHLTGDPAGLASALDTISRRPITIFDFLRGFGRGGGQREPGRSRMQGSLDDSIFETHPATSERIKRLKAM